MTTQAPDAASMAAPVTTAATPRAIPRVFVGSLEYPEQLRPRPRTVYGEGTIRALVCIIKGSEEASLALCVDGGDVRGYFKVQALRELGAQLLAAADHIEAGLAA